ncbi:MAG: alpha/beta hydrolase [Myxococcales bacterium]|nr:alpha/beta hydrolase [Myxococcales bacterium]
MDQSRPTRRRIPAADGLELSLYEWSQEGTPLLLLHGFGNDAHVWDEFAPAVASYYRTLALDQRGHGDSDRDPQRRYDSVSMARDVEAVCEALDLKRLVLVGHSMGGRVGIRFAARNPEKMAGFVIVDSGAELDRRGTTRIRLEAEEAQQDFASPREFEALLQRNYPATRPEILKRLSHHWLRERADGRFEPKLDPAFRKLPEGMSREDFEKLAEHDSRELKQALKKIPCPTLVVRGAASDVLSPEEADSIADDTLPNGSLAVVSQAGHSVMLDNPEGFLDAVAAFVFGED